MRRRLCTIGNTEIFLHPATLLMLLYAWGMGTGQAVLVSLLSIMLHEAAHAAVAAAFGAMPVEIELTPLGAMMRLDTEEKLTLWKRLLMLLAGPLMTFGLCLLALWGAKAGALNVTLGRILFMSNAALLLLNVLPALPLDGGRIVSAAVGAAFGPGVSRRAMRMLGTVLGLGMLGVNLWVNWKFGGWNLSLTAIGCFLLYASCVATTTQAMAELRAFLDRRIRLEKKGSLRCEMVAVLSDLPIRWAVRKLHPAKVTIFRVFQVGTMTEMGGISEFILAQKYLSSPISTCGDALKGEK